MWDPGNKELNSQDKPKKYDGEGRFRCNICETG